MDRNSDIFEAKKDAILNDSRWILSYRFYLYMGFCQQYTHKLIKSI